MLFKSEDYLLLFEAIFFKFKEQNDYTFTT